VAAPALAGTRWAIDSAHTQVEFAVKHMMLAKVRGRFAEFEGSVAFETDEVTSAAIEVRIAAASIDTRVAQRDEHLRSADFFDVGQYPELRFTSRRIEERGDDEYRVVGELTIRGVAREVTLDARFEGTGRDPWGGTRIAFSAAGRIDRREYGLTWNQALETGGILVGDEIRLAIEAELVLQ
jgi:polyisoprenoid-binding protein YceI